MPDPALRPRQRWPLFLCIAATILVLAAAALPQLAERFLLPRLVEGAGLHGHRITISQVSTQGCSLHITGTRKNSPILTGSVRAEWDFSHLLHGRLRRLTGEGFLLNLEDKTEINADTSTPKESSTTDTGNVPLIVDHIDLHNSFILLPGEEPRRLLPFSLSLDLQNVQSNDAGASLRYQVLLNAAGQELRGGFDLDRKGNIAGTAEASLNLSAIASFLASSLAEHAQGLAHVDASYKATLFPPQLKNVRAIAQFSDWQVGVNSGVLSSAATHAARLVVSGRGERFLVQGNDFALKGPLNATIAFTSEVALAEDMISWQGNLTLRPDREQRIAGQTFHLDMPSLSLIHQGSIDTDGIEALLQTGAAGAKPPQGPSKFTGRDSRLQFDSLTGTARLLVPLNGEQPPNIDITLKTTGVVADFPSSLLRVPALNFQGTAVLPKTSGDEQWSARADLAISDGDWEIPGQDIRLNGLQLALPLSWPVSDQKRTGDLRIGKMSKGSLHLGDFAGNFSQAQGVIALQGQLHSPFVHEQGIHISGAIHPQPLDRPQADATWTLTKGSLAAEELAQLHPALKSLRGSATLDLKGHLQIDHCGLRGDMAVNLQDGNFSLPDAQLNLDDVAFSLRLPRLPELESAPSQTLSIGTMRTRKVAVTDLQTSFRIESPQSLFIEHIAAKWSGGRISSNAIRLRRNVGELQLAVICDRLQLAQILSQLNLAEANGEGVLSGQVPLLYRDNEIKVDDGFLFTSPGDKGSLQITRSNYVDVGLAAKAPQFSPIHFAGAALGDFEYNWAKLNILSEEENLLLKLQIDGRPRQRLPYRFDADTNMFIRLPEGATGGIDQPVKLDVNFRVPVNELLRNQKILLPILRNLN